MACKVQKYRTSLSTNNKFVKNSSEIVKLTIKLFIMDVETDALANYTCSVFLSPHIHVSSYMHFYFQQPLQYIIPYNTFSRSMHTSSIRFALYHMALAVAVFTYFVSAAAFSLQSKHVLS